MRMMLREEGAQLYKVPLKGTMIWELKALIQKISSTKQLK